MLCPKCGKQLDDGLQFCSSCGSPLTESTNTDSNNANTAFNEQYQNQNNTSNNWGAQMSPKKKSKAPIIIALSSILLAAVIITVICVLAFCGKKDGQSTAKEALNATFKASSKYDFDETLDTLHPLMKDTSNILKKEDKSRYKKMKEDMSDSFFPVESAYSISDFKSEEVTISASEIKELNESISSVASEFSSEFDVEFDTDDYKIEKAIGYSGSYTATFNGDTETIYFDIIVVKCDDRWFTLTVETY